MTTGLGLGLLPQGPGSGGSERIDLYAPGPEYLYVDWVRTRSLDGTILPLDHLTPQFAFTPTLAADTVRPASGDWIPGLWSAQPSPTPEGASAALLVGTGGDIDPGLGDYSIWVRIVGGIEEPIRMIGRLVIQ